MSVRCAWTRTSFPTLLLDSRPFSSGLGGGGGGITQLDVLFDCILVFGGGLWQFALHSRLG